MSCLDICELDCEMERGRFEQPVLQIYIAVLYFEEKVEDIGRTVLGTAEQMSRAGRDTKEMEMRTRNVMLNSIYIIN
jgi:hypothetical protein